MNDTIAAVATAQGGALAVLRLSGDLAYPILVSVFPPAQKKQLDSHVLSHGWLMNGNERVDEVMAVYMRAPRSYTGEDVVEIHCHGGHVIVEQILSLLCSNGARPALAGEFTRRAFENGRMDLSQAEAVMALVSARTSLQAKAAVGQLEGVLSNFVFAMQERLTALLAALGAAIDYPDEIEEEQTAQEVLIQISEMTQTLQKALHPGAAKVLWEGLRVVIAGRPNVGKSSLLNALAGEDRAIVTPVAGTTRDVLTQAVVWQGIAVLLCDTAGLRETEDAIEQMGVSRARREVQRADVLCAVFDLSTPKTQEDEELLALCESIPSVVVQNKSDLPAIWSYQGPARTVTTCAYRQEGIEGLRKMILSCIEQLPTGEEIISQERHVQAVYAAIDHLKDAATALDASLPPDVVAIDLQGAWSALGEITGTSGVEGIIDRIFADFCVGK